MVAATASASSAIFIEGEWPAYTSHSLQAMRVLISEPSELGLEQAYLLPPVPTRMLLELGQEQAYLLAPVPTRMLSE